MDSWRVFLGRYLFLLIIVNHILCIDINDDISTRSANLYTPSAGYPHSNATGNLDVGVDGLELHHTNFGKIKLDSVVNCSEKIQIKDNVAATKEVPIEQLLLRKLLSTYEKSVRPVQRAQDVVVVKMGLTLTQIFDLDEKNQILITNAWLDQEWDDVFLKWNPTEFQDLRVLRLPCNKIWRPDIVLYNNAAEYTNGLMPARAMVTHEGNVFWPVPAKLLSSCKIDVTYFPFDKQECDMKFGSWTYDGFQVDMTNRTTEVDLSNYVTNGGWELMKVEIKRNVVFYACCPEPFPDVTFTIVIQRRRLYYFFNVIIPCVMMSILTLLVFYLPPESGEKVTMGITVFLSFCVFMLQMSEKLPETSEFIPLLSIYLMVVMSMMSLSVIMTVLVLNLYNCGPNTKRVPERLRRLIRKKEVYQWRDWLKVSMTNYSLMEAAETPQKILKALQNIVAQTKSKDVTSSIYNEWRSLAIAVDRILFCIFTSGTLGAITFLLIVAPMTKPF